MNRFLIKIKYGVWCVLIVCCACGGNKKEDATGPGTVYGFVD